MNLGNVLPPASTSSPRKSNRAGGANPNKGGDQGLDKLYADRGNNIASKTQIER